MFLFLHWNVVIAWALIFADAVENPNRQIVLFDDFRKGSLAKSNRLEIFLASSKRKCALRCLKNSECSSFTFCENKSCQLTSIDAFLGGVQLIPDAGCLYNGKPEGSKRHRYQQGFKAEQPETTQSANHGILTRAQSAPLQTTSSPCIQSTSMLGVSLCVITVNNSLENFKLKTWWFLVNYNSLNDKKVLSFHFMSSDDSRGQFISFS